MNPSLEKRDGKGRIAMRLYTLLDAIPAVLAIIRADTQVRPYGSFLCDLCDLCG
jgi:hypothetical protein